MKIVRFVCDELKYLSLLLKGQKKLPLRVVADDVEFNVLHFVIYAMYNLKISIYVEIFFKMADDIIQIDRFNIRLDCPSRWRGRGLFK